MPNTTLHPVLKLEAGIDCGLLGGRASYSFLCSQPSCRYCLQLYNRKGRRKQRRNDGGFSRCRIMVLAGDTLPIEVYCHLPVMCEDQNLPYVYIPSKTVSLHLLCPTPNLVLDRLYEEVTPVLEFTGLGGLFPPYVTQAGPSLLLKQSYHTKTKHGWQVSFL